MAELQIDPQTADTPPASELGIERDSDDQTGVENSSRVPVNPADGVEMAHANSQLSLSYDGSEMDDFLQDGADSQPAEATRLKSIVVTPTSATAIGSKRPIQNCAAGFDGPRSGSPAMQQDAPDGWGDFPPSMPPAQLHQLRLIHMQQQAFAARAGSGAANPLRRPARPWSGGDQPHARVTIGTQQQQLRMPLPRPPGQPWSHSPVSAFPNLPAGVQGGRPLSKQEFEHMQQLGVPILPFAGHSGHEQQRSGQLPPSFPAPSQTQSPAASPAVGGNRLRDAPPLESGRRPGVPQPPPTAPPAAAVIPMDERLKVAEERRRMQAELNRLTRENAVLEARVHARTKLEAGRGRGRGRAGRGKGRTSVVLNMRDAAPRDPPSAAAGPSSGASNGPRGAGAPFAAAVPAPQDADAAVKAREMMLLKAKIAALENRKSQRQGPGQSPPKARKRTIQKADATLAPSQPFSASANGTASTPSTEKSAPAEQPAPAEQAVRAEVADIATPAGTIFDSEDWDDGDAGWPPPEDEEPAVRAFSLAEEEDLGLPDASLLQQTVASGSLSAGIDAAPPAAGEVSRRRHKKRHGEEKKHKRDRSDRESQEERKERKRRDRSNRHNSVTAPDSFRSHEAQREKSPGDLRDQLDTERRRKRSRFAPDR